jgi:hypothetical protein
MGRRFKTHSENLINGVYSDILTLLLRIFER